MSHYSTLYKVKLMLLCSYNLTLITYVKQYYFLRKFKSINLIHGFRRRVKEGNPVNFDFIWSASLPSSRAECDLITKFCRAGKKNDDVNATGKGLIIVI